MTGVVTNFVSNTLARADQINAAFLQAFPAASVTAFSETLTLKTTASQWRVALGVVAAPAAANDNEVALFDGGYNAVKSSGALWSSVARINVSQAWTGTQNFTGSIVTVADQAPSANPAGSSAASNTKYIWDFFNYVVSVGGIVGVDSPAFTGNPTAPTPSAGDNDTSIATTAFVQTAINNRVPATNTQYGLIYGNGTSALAVTAAMTNGQVLVGQTGAAPLPKTVSGDATMAASGALTVTKINGQPVGTSAGNIVALDGSARLPAVDGSQLTNLPTSGGGSLANLAISVTSNSALSVTADRLPLYTSGGGAKVFNAVSVNIDLASGGLDTGSEASSTWYYVWIFSDGTNLTGRLSVSATAPTAPGGYSYSARVGAVRNDASSNLLRTIQRGRRVTLVVGTNPTALPVMISGASGSPTAPTWTAVAVGGFVPPTAAAIELVVASISTSTGNLVVVAPNNSYGAINSYSNPPPIGFHASGSSHTAAHRYSMLLEGSNVYYAALNSGQLMCIGWEDNL